MILMKGAWTKNWKFYSNDDRIFLDVLFRYSRMKSLKRSYILSLRLSQWYFISLLHSAKLQTGVSDFLHFYIFKGAASDSKYVNVKNFYTWSSNLLKFRFISGCFILYHCNCPRPFAFDKKETFLKISLDWYSQTSFVYFIPKCCLILNTEWTFYKTLKFMLQIFLVNESLVN